MELKLDQQTEEAIGAFLLLTIFILEFTEQQQKMVEPFYLILYKNDKRKREAEKELARLSQLPKDEANKQVRQMKKDDPLLYDKVKGVKDEIDQGLTAIERSAKSLGVKDGTRARYVWAQLQKVETAKEKNALVKEWRRKKIISDTVFEQLKKMKGGER